MVLTDQIQTLSLKENWRKINERERERERERNDSC